MAFRDNSHDLAIAGVSADASVSTSASARVSSAVDTVASNFPTREGASFIVSVRNANSLTAARYLDVVLEESDVETGRSDSVSSNDWDAVKAIDLNANFLNGSQIVDVETASSDPAHAIGDRTVRVNSSSSAGAVKTLAVSYTGSKRFVRVKYENVGGAQTLVAVSRFATRGVSRSPNPQPTGTPDS